MFFFQDLTSQNSFIQCESKKYSYQDLENDSNILASAFSFQGKTVAFMINGSYDYIKTLVAIWKSGNIAVPLSSKYPISELKYFIQDSTAECLLYREEIAPELKAFTECLSIENLESNNQNNSLPKLYNNQDALIIYTSGTTNKPKGVVHKFGSIQNQVDVLLEVWKWESQDHIPVFLPLHHIHAIVNKLCCAIACRASISIFPSFDVETQYNNFIQKHYTVFMAVPTVYKKLIDYHKVQLPNLQKQFKQACNSFRLMVSGSAALPVAFLEQWKEISGHTLLERYGMTEVGMAVSNPYQMDKRKPGHIGIPLPTTKLKIENGQIYLKGPSLFSRYWNKPAATREAFTVDGWFKTGDMAEYSGECIKIIGRNSVDIIKSGGYKISALEIEEAIRQFDENIDCAVIGLPNEEWGEIIVCAFSNGSQDLEQELLIFLKSKLASQKIPRKFFYLNELPRNAMGKLQKNLLKKSLQYA